VLLSLRKEGGGATTVYREGAAAREPGDEFLELT